MKGINETDPVHAGFGLVTEMEQSVAVITLDVSSMGKKGTLHQTLIQNESQIFFTGTFILA